MPTVTYFCPYALLPGTRRYCVKILLNVILMQGEMASLVLLNSCAENAARVYAVSVKT